MATKDIQSRSSQCSFCHFYCTSMGRQGTSRKCPIKDAFVEAESPICNHFFLNHIIWCTKRHQCIPTPSCLKKQKEMRENLKERKWSWSRCINCVEGVLIFHLNAMTQATTLRLVGRGENYDQLSG